MVIVLNTIPVFTSIYKVFCFLKIYFYFVFSDVFSPNWREWRDETKSWKYGVLQAG